MLKDDLGDRMKTSYEDRTRYLLPRRTYAIIRVDGKAFHTFTKFCDRPYDHRLMGIMDDTAKILCKEIQGAKFAYTQSDEISVLITDFSQDITCAWFDGNIQKMVSVAASIATTAFNRAWMASQWEKATDREKLIDCEAISASVVRMANFDARIFTIPDPTEVENYFIWRQNDASKNSIQMAARALYSHKELEGKSVSDLHELLYLKGINWNSYTSGEKRGRAIVKEAYNVKIANSKNTVARTRWVSLNGSNPTNETPIFTQDRNFLSNLIPQMPSSLRKQ